jgi:hypothetical protein
MKRTPLRFTSLKSAYTRRAAELAQRGHLNERGQPFSAASLDAQVKRLSRLAQFVCGMLCCKRIADLLQLKLAGAETYVAFDLDDCCNAHSAEEAHGRSGAAC